jgi:hypothetical protein
MQNKEAGWVVDPSICGKGNKAVTQRKRTLVMEHYRFLGQTIRGRGTRQ